MSRKSLPRGSRTACTLSGTLTGLRSSRELYVRREGLIWLGPCLDVLLWTKVTAANLRPVSRPQDENVNLKRYIVSKQIT